MAEHLILVLSLLTSALLGWRLQEAHGRKKAGLAPDPALPPVSTVQTGADWPATLVLETLCQDIRARISGMVGLSEQLLAAPLGDDQQRQAELIADSGRTMLRLLGDVMDVTRIDAGGLRLQAEPSDLRELLDHHVNLMQAATRARGLTLALMVDDAVPARVLVDRARLRQVLLNLIGNAVKFTEHGRIDVQARVAQTATGPQLAISVIDPGVGIARAAGANFPAVLSPAAGLAPRPPDYQRHRSWPGPVQPHCAGHGRRNRAGKCARTGQLLHRAPAAGDTDRRPGGRQRRN